MAVIQQLLSSNNIVVPTITFLGTTMTTGISIGSARSDRIIVVASFTSNNGSVTSALPTINGGPATVVFQPTATDPCAMGYLVVSSGTTVDLASAGGTVQDAAWLITGVTTLNTSSTSIDSVTGLVGTWSSPSAPSAIIACGRSRNNPGTWGMTAQSPAAHAVLDTYTNGAGESWAAGHADSSASGTASVTFTNSGWNGAQGGAAIFTR